MAQRLIRPGDCLQSPISAVPTAAHQQPADPPRRCLPPTHRRPASPPTQPQAKERSVMSTIHHQPSPQPTDVGPPPARRRTASALRHAVSTAVRRPQRQPPRELLVPLLTPICSPSSSLGVGQDGPHRQRSRLQDVRGRGHGAGCPAQRACFSGSASSSDLTAGPARALAAPIPRPLRGVRNLSVVPRGERTPARCADVSHLARCQLPRQHRVTRRSSGPPGCSRVQYGLAERAPPHTQADGVHGAVPAFAILPCSLPDRCSIMPSRGAAVLFR